MHEGQVLQKNVTYITLPLAWRLSPPNGEKDEFKRTGSKKPPKSNRVRICSRTRFRPYPTAEYFIRHNEVRTVDLYRGNTGIFPVFPLA